MPPSTMGWEHTGDDSTYCGEMLGAWHVLRKEHRGTVRISEVLHSVAQKTCLIQGQQRRFRSYMSRCRFNKDDELTIMMIWLTLGLLRCIRVRETAAVQAYDLVSELPIWRMPQRHSFADVKGRPISPKHGIWSLKDGTTCLNFSLVRVLGREFI